jgi:hypothetical protein
MPFTRVVPLSGRLFDPGQAITSDQHRPSLAGSKGRKIDKARFGADVPPCDYFGAIVVASIWLAFYVIMAVF